VSGSGGSEDTSLIQVPPGTPPPPPPPLVAQNHSYTAVFGQAFSPAAGNRLLSDSEVSQGKSVLRVVASPSGGAGSITSFSADGAFVFTPSQGWSGAASWGWWACVWA